jgi:hypothetical protein
MDEAEQIDALQNELLNVIGRFQQEFDAIKLPQVVWVLEQIKLAYVGVDVEFEMEMDLDEDEPGDDPVS